MVERIYQYLFIAFVFLLPLSIAGANIVVYTMLILWLCSGHYKQKIEPLKSNKLIIAALLFFIMHIVGLIWTENISEGLHNIKKIFPMALLLPVLMSIAKKQYIDQYLYAFLVAIFISALLSILIHLGIIPAFKLATVENPTVFMTHISYNIFLAFASYISIGKVLWGQQKKWVYYLHIFNIIVLALSMFTTNGRAGHITYFLLVAILIFQYFNKQKILASVLSILIVAAIFTIAYNTSNSFYSRVNQTVENIYQINNYTNNSINIRANLALNTLSIIKNHPIFGVGTGDFSAEYTQVHKQRTPRLILYASNPHNMWAFKWAQLGVFGVILMLYILYTQIRIARHSDDIFIKNIGIALPATFFVIMFFEIYLYLHYTKLLFVFLSAFLYKDFSKEPAPSHRTRAPITS